MNVRASEGTAVRTRLWVAVAFGLVIAAGVVLRFVTRSDLWLDEALSVNIARLPVGDIPDALRRDGAPPLYYVLLHYWMELFGEGDTAVRALSGVCAVATLPALYFAGKRLGGRTTGWVAVVVLAVSPFAIRYATEARMYALVMVLVAWGYLAVVRALERPSLLRCALVAVVTAGLLYTHNWSWYLLAVVGALMIGIAWRGVDPDRRRAARRIIVAMVAGGVCYLPWLPVLQDQLAKTGTPWADPLLPWSGVMDAFDGFGGVGSPIHGEALVLRSLIILLLALGVFGAAIDARRVELDVYTRPIVRWEAIVGFGTLLVGLTLSWILGAAFVSRYASAVAPLLLLVAAVGICVFVGPVARAVVLGLVVVLGLAGGVRNVVDNRTQAAQVAEVIAAEAEPGDVVLYCPDQLGPAVHRLLPRDLDLVEVTFPDLEGPEFVNWIDYRDRIAEADAGAFAAEVTQRYDDRTIWFVMTPGYRSVEGKCEHLYGSLGNARLAVGRVEIGQTDFFEYMGLTEYPGP